MTAIIERRGSKNETIFKPAFCGFFLLPKYIGKKI